MDGATKHGVKYEWFHFPDESMDWSMSTKASLLVPVPPPDRHARSTKQPSSGSTHVIISSMLHNVRAAVGRFA